MDREQGNYGLLITTAGNKEDATKIAKRLLADRLVACVQMIPIESYYTWKGETTNEPELLMLIKTKTSLFEETMAAIKDVHPYETPEIVGTDFVAGFAGYFAWIDEVTK